MAKTYIFDPAVVGQKGGAARAARLTPERRREIARSAAIARHHPQQFLEEKRHAEEVTAFLHRALDSYTQAHASQPATDTDDRTQSLFLNQ